MKKLDTLKKTKAISEQIGADDVGVFRQLIEDSRRDQDFTVVSRDGDMTEAGLNAICELRKALENAHGCDDLRKADPELIEKAYTRDTQRHLNSASHKLASAQQLAHMVETLGKMPKGTRFTIKAPEAMPDVDGKCGPNLSVDIYLDDLYNAMRLLLRSRVIEASGELDGVVHGLKW